MTTRDSFLAAVADRLVAGIPLNPLRPMTGLANDPIEYTHDLTDPVSAFEQAARVSGAELIDASSMAIHQIIDRMLETVEPAVVSVSRDPECEGVEQYLRDAGVEIAPSNEPEAVAAADLGVTGAVAGVALTGSVAVDSRRASGRLVSLLPRVHLALISSGRIVATPGDLLRDLDYWLPDGLPSNLVFITGPSRSADIELQITKGVHGPHELFIAIVDSPA